MQIAASQDFFRTSFHQPSSRGGSAVDSSSVDQDDNGSKRREDLHGVVVHGEVVQGSARRPVQAVLESSRPNWQENDPASSGYRKGQEAPSAGVMAYILNQSLGEPKNQHSASGLIDIYV